MNHLTPIVHWLGTKPLTVSLVAQSIVLILALKSRDKEKLVQSVILMVGLISVIVSIALRPPAPILTLPDVLGTVAAFLFLVPALQSLLKLRQPKSDSE